MNKFRVEEIKAALKDDIVERFRTSIEDSEKTCFNGHALVNDHTLLNPQLGHGPSSDT